MDRRFDARHDSRAVVSASGPGAAAPDRSRFFIGRAGTTRSARVGTDGLVRDRGRRLLAGTLPVLLILTFSRWGSTIGLGSLYLTDVLILLAVVHSTLTYRSRTGPASAARIRLSSLPLVFVLFLVYVVARVLFAYGSGPIVDWLRDAAPYLYGGLAVMSATSYSRADAATKQRTARYLTAGLIVHLCWSSLEQLTTLHETAVMVPFVGAPIFSPRPDIEAALNSVLAALCLRAIIVHRYRFISVLGLALACVVILAQGTRAGTISLIACLAISFTLTYAGLGRLDGRRVVMTLAAPAVLIVAVIVLPLTPPGQRLVATIFPDQAISDAQQNAEGTAHARQLVWSGVINWTSSSTPRLFAGSGFGNDFLSASGTLQYLEGTDYTGVRSPHDYWIGSFARLGAFGLALLLASVVAGLVVVVVARSAIAREPTAFICAVLLVAIVPVASLGVVLEAPFGAVPFFWALGVVYTFRTPSPVGPPGTAIVSDDVSGLGPAVISAPRVRPRSGP